MFYIKFDSDLNIVSAYQADTILNTKFCFELANVFEQELISIQQGNKQYTTEIFLGKPITFKGELIHERLTLFKYLYYLNSFASKQLVSTLMIQPELGFNLEKKSIYEILTFYHQLSPDDLKLFCPSIVYIKNKKIYPFSYLYINNLIDFIIQLSVIDDKILLVRYRDHGQKKYMMIGGQFIDQEYDTLIPYLIQHEIENLNIENVYLNSPYINFMGDTYFGEKYSEKRKKKNIKDALIKYGYHHSFQEISRFFRQEDFNIINFEAVFNTTDISSLNGRKGFILGAESNATRKELKVNQIDMVCLANNHALDYGEYSFIKTIQDFYYDGFIVLGGGKNQYQANKIIEFTYQNKKIAIFNGYWKKINAYIDYEFYALNDRAGINILNGVMLYQIEQYKKYNPDSIVLCFCHWGLDYQPVHNYQQSLARRLIIAGADLIIGHGSHTLQKIDQYQGKFIIYSIGNGVFNNDGEYKQKQALSYGFLVRLNILTQEIYLYPIYTNNLKTFWQPRRVVEDEFKQLQEIYKENGFIADQDEFGFLFRLKW